MSSSSVDDRLHWSDDDHLAVVDGVPFVIMRWQTTELLAVYKPRSMLRHYFRIFDEISPRHVLELGIYRGGSAAFFSTLLRPDRFTAVDLSPSRVTSLDDYLRERGLDDAVRLHYGVDQADAATLDSIVADDFGATPLDLVIDDASHLYEPTVASFEALFPRVRPGGYYAIEDWWGEDRWIDLLLGAFAAPTEEMFATVADVFAHEDSLGATAMRWWVTRARCEPAARDHDVVTAWFRTVEERPSSPELDAMLERARRCVTQWDDGTLPAPQTLLTLATQLVLAHASAPDALASLFLADGLIVVRRGDRPLEPGSFRLSDLADDRMGVLGRPPRSREA